MRTMVLNPLDLRSGHVDPSPTIMVLGGAQDTGNLGVSALGLGCVKGILTALPNAKIIFERRRVPGRARLQFPDRVLDVETIRLYPCPRPWAKHGTKRVEWVMSAARKLPRRLASWALTFDETASKLARADIVIDISAGDSFADIYGPLAYAQQLGVKQFVIERGKPLVFAPQTYGPFTDPRALSAAVNVMSRSLLAATREVSGKEEARSTFGAATAERMVTSPDMAFLLDPVSVASDEEPFPFSKRSNEVMIGLNVSGLFYLKSNLVKVAVPYRELCRRIADWVLGMPNTKLLLVPHVIGQVPLPDDPEKWPSGMESDTPACRMLMQELQASGHADRVGCLSWPRTAGETKYLIGKCDFFIGTRMHACIAGVSQCVPTATLAYSKKAAGVMAMVGVEDTVIDLRMGTVESCMAAIDRLYRQRQMLSCRLAEKMPEVRLSAQDFFNVYLVNAMRAAGLVAYGPAQAA